MSDLLKFDAELSARHKLNLLAQMPCVPKAVSVSLVGSMYIHGEGKDYDYVVCVPGREVAREALVDDLGFTATGDGSGEDDEFWTFRKGEINVMLTEDTQFRSDFERAAEVCKYVAGLFPELEVDGTPFRGDGLTKAHRIKIHRIIMNGEEA